MFISSNKYTNKHISIPIPNSSLKKFLIEFQLAGSIKIHFPIQVRIFQENSSSTERWKKKSVKTITFEQALTLLSCRLLIKHEKKKRLRAKENKKKRRKKEKGKETIYHRLLHPHSTSHLNSDKWVCVHTTHTLCVHNGTQKRKKR